MGWNDFYLFAGGASLFWLIGALLTLRKNTFSGIGMASYICGTLVFGLFLLLLWSSLQRPPLRTMGETRLWYSFFMAVSGMITYARWKFRWILSFTTLMSIVFCIINFVKPEIHDQTLMPALQSVWFIPHVTVYMFAYSLLGCAFLIAILGLIQHKTTFLQVTDSLVAIGLSFLTIGMLLGSIWAKEAWGDYWSWDPKETWAFITWLGYLVYLHLRLQSHSTTRLGYTIVIVSFLTLQMCWYGVNYLPAAKQSIHAYSRE